MNLEIRDWKACGEEMICSICNKELGGMDPHIECRKLEALESIAKSLEKIERHVF